MEAKKKNVLIGGAWPYSNGKLHLGHLAGLLPGDVIARYYRLIGANVLYVSGSDCHGSPITVTAHQEKVTPEVIATKYHQLFKDCFEKLSFTYDNYSNTMKNQHKELVQKYFLELNNSNLFYSKKVKMAYCNELNRFVPDRYIIGKCYKCGYDRARGDQCENCGTLIDVELLENKICVITNTAPCIKEDDDLMFSLSEFKNHIIEILKKYSGNWKNNAVALTKRYLNEGLRDRSVVRDLEWGIDVPIEEFKEKKIYVWFEAVLGYLTASIELAEKQKFSWEKFWDNETIAYFVHGKDNIPFHTIIFPSILKGLGIKLEPTYIISSEYLTIEGKKISTSQNWAVWVDEYLSKYDPDPLRYYLIMNNPEKRDSDFSWSDFVSRNNSELLGSYGNFVNRTLSLIKKNNGNSIPAYKSFDDDDNAILDEVNALYVEIGELIEKGALKDALNTIFSSIRNANKYIDRKAPWKSENAEFNHTTLYVCANLIVNFSNLLNPFIPNITEKALSFFNLEPSWSILKLEQGSSFNNPEVLVSKLDKSIIAEEVQKIGN